MVKLAAILMLLATSASAQLLENGQDRREIDLQVIDGRALVAVAIDGQSGLMMIDNGTPQAVMLNRDAVTLSAGQEVGRGVAASGQSVVVDLHEAPVMTVAGRPFALPERVTSGNFAFVEEGFGAGFMGFIGSPVLSEAPFLLDLSRKRMVVMRSVSLDLIQADVRGRIFFSIWNDSLPTSVVEVGRTAMLVDFDTGDSGTLYLRDATRAALVAGGNLCCGPGIMELSGLRIGGVDFSPTPVRVVQAGGPEDFRRTGASDNLRLGASFLMQNPVLWDFASRELVFLTSTATVLAP
ncbi:hypothetical protein [Tabrizicola sp. BL-A-41-H6]|uniref:hypothetical protein n=1 Tax=Tabrizicola sp. BL-A-41-H6 TaxID=3421107 RepID=UPI003D66916D